jgi:hypothetical protein
MGITIHKREGSMARIARRFPCSDLLRWRHLLSLTILLSLSAIVGKTAAQIPAAQQEFLAFATPKFNLLADVRSRLAMGKAVGVAAVPTIQPPAERFDALVSGSLVGALHVPTGFARLKLTPGVYAVHSMREGEQWFASFRDASGREVSRGVARMTRAQRVAEPTATLESSVCWRFDEAEFCV